MDSGKDVEQDSGDSQRIDIFDDAAVQSWATKLNSTPSRVMLAVAVVGDTVEQVRRFLRAPGRPSGARSGEGSDSVLPYLSESIKSKPAPAPPRPEDGQSGGD